MLGAARGIHLPPASAPLAGADSRKRAVKTLADFVQDLVGNLLTPHGAFAQDLASRRLSDQHEYNSNDIHRVHDDFIPIHL